MYLTLVEVTAREGLTLSRIIADMPHDGAAFFIYALTAVSLWLIWQGSRTRDRREDAHRGEDDVGVPPNAEAAEVAGVSCVEGR